CYHSVLVTNILSFPTRRSSDLQPFIELDIIFNDQAANAKKSGLSHATLGLETRYEISKKVMPYLQVGYEYSQGNKQTAWQQASGSDQGWIYALGLKMMF